MVIFSPTPATDGHREPNLPEAIEQRLGNAIIAIDSSRRIVAFNSVAESLLGLAASDVLDQSLDVLPGPLREALLETLHHGRPILERQICVAGSPAPTIPLRLTTIATRRAENETPGAIAVLSDLNRGILDDKLRQLGRLASIGTLSVGMAHEIKNALVAVRTFVDLLISQSPETKFSDLVSREIRRIDTLVNQMLRFSAPDRQTYSPVSVHEVIEQSLQLLQRELPERQIELHRSLQAQPDQILGDPCQLEQAFLNIAFNALDAMGPHGKLSVASILVPDGSGQAPGTSLLEVTISDTGDGIAPEIQDRLFEPFFTTKANGSGLGLAITRRIVEDHGGTIRVESQRARGTTFFLRLPLVSA